MELNYIAIIAASIAQFVTGAIWYTALFGNLWGKMHGFDKLSKETQQEMMKQMPPIYGVQLVVTVIMTAVLAYLMNITTISPYLLAVVVWLGFILPTQTSAVLFGGTDNKWIVTKIAVQSAGSLVSLLVAAAVLQLMG